MMLRAKRPPLRRLRGRAARRASSPGASGRPGTRTRSAGRAGSASTSAGPRQLYDFRLQHGFTDVADAAFERCWDAEHITWDGIREICKETGAADRVPSKVPVDLLRQK